MLNLFRTRNRRSSVVSPPVTLWPGKEQKKPITSLSLAGKSLFAMDIFRRAEMAAFSNVVPASVSNSDRKRLPIILRRMNEAQTKT